MKAFQDKLFQKAEEAGFENWELYLARGKSFEVKIWQGEPVQYKNAGPVGLSFRGLYKGRMGYAYSEKLSEDVIDFLIQSVRDNAEIIEDRDPALLYGGDTASFRLVKAESNVVSAAPEDIPVEHKIDLAKRMEKAAYATDSRILAVDHCLLGTGEEEIYLANSLGLSRWHSSRFAFAYVNVRAVEQDGGSNTPKVAGEFWMGRDFQNFSPETLGEEAVKKALSYLGAAPVHSGKYAVLFDPVTAGRLLGVFAGAFFAEKVHKGFSLLGGKLGDAVGAPAVTLRDDPAHELSPSVSPFDSEGVSCRRKGVVEQGVLKTYLHNLKTAQKDGVQSTGNGFKSSFRGPIDTACTNFYIVPSSHSQEELLVQMGEGLLITELSGLHSGANSISGDFSLPAAGYLIREGKIARPVEQITVAGNFYEWLKGIQAVGRDLRFGLPSHFGTVGAPSVLTQDMDIAGE